MSRRWPPGLLAAATCLFALYGEGQAATPPGGIDVLNYDVALTVDFDARAISGETAIRLRAAAGDQTKFVVSNNRLAITSARMNGETVEVQRAGNELTFVFPRPLRRGAEAVITVAYNGKPARGLVFGQRTVATGYFTCDWMICPLDNPGDKASLTLALTGPSRMVGHGPGILKSTASAGAGLTRTVWREDRPYSTYLYGFALGEFRQTVIPGQPVDVLVLSPAAETRDMAGMFAPTGDMLRFFQDKAGVPFPQKRYVQVFTPGDDAQEAANFSLLGDDVVSPRLTDPQEDWAIAHELAHQWWGNSVTCADWSQFWLNEGVTTFMVAAWKEHRWGREAYDGELAILRRRVDNAVKAGVDRKLTSTEPYPNLGLRRAVQYSKGALFMDALRQELGDAAFWKALRAYTRAHAGGVVDSRDFQRDFERSSGRDLSALFTAWVY